MNHITVMEQALDALEKSNPLPRKDDDDYCETGWKEHANAIQALRAAITKRIKEQPVPEGMMLVPEVISEAMYEAYHKVDDAAWFAGSPNGANMSEIWAAMLEAAKEPK